jgi:hypothetical protein
MPTQTESAPSLDPIERLVHARLWVARLGESDLYGWWGSDGILGEDGAFVGPRVLPLTHGTGRARIALAVARHACDQRHPANSTQHLFRLDAATEDQVDAYLVEHLSAFDYWNGILAQLSAVEIGADIAETLLGAGVLDESDLSYAHGRPLGPGGRSVPIEPGASFSETVRRLAAGFLRSAPSELAVPYIQAEMGG